MRGASTTLAVLTLGQSDLRQGFPASLRIGSADGPLSVVAGGVLPIRPEIYQLYADWAMAYRRAGLPSSAILADPQRRDLKALRACLSLAQQLGEALNDWLQCPAFAPIQEALFGAIAPHQTTHLLIETENTWLQRLPWSLWEVCDRCPHLEIALGLPVPTPTALVPPFDKPPEALRVLLVVSNGQGIDVRRDDELLQQLPQASTCLLVEPRQTDFEAALRAAPWDLLLFTGIHPDGEPETCRLYINPAESLPVETVRSLLIDRMQQGLRAAVLNACDGQGLVRSLDIGLPQLVVLREPVPDRVAYLFFKVILRTFVQGEPFYTAVRQAREALRGSKFPCGGWLPVVFYHPATVQGAVAERRSNPPAAVMTEPISEVTELRAEAAPFHQAAESGLINHRYRICRVLGRGGFGQTYLATDTHRFEEPCVLKRFSPTTTSAASLRKARELFQREAKVLYQIDHPQIPKFLAWFTHDEHLFIVQEYIEGQSYLDLLRDRQQRGQTFTEAEMLPWLLDLLPVLGYLHNLGLVHRDISPANIMYSVAKQKPVLIDFGVVKEVVNQLLSGQQSSLIAPPKATLVGKPGYSPPEQVRLGDCYPCSDFYALGITAIVLLTGQDPRWLLDVEVTPAAWRPYADVSDGLAAVLTKMTVARPRERYQFAEDILTDLQPLRQPSPPALPSNLGTAAIALDPPTSVDRPLAAPLDEHWEDSDFPAPSNLAADLPVSPAFIVRCRQELVQIIGPMAGFLIDDLLADDPTLTQMRLIEAIASEIPDEQLAEQFRQRLENL
ncbi:MAG: protein kinase [Synechococcales bacterium]|nr:protein kinase [Synechococcales bacterium]